MKRPSMAAMDLIPAKGTAARQEQLPDPGELPSAEPEQLVLKPARTVRVVRVPLTVKVSEPVYKRLREASHREEIDKQDLVDQALDALLAKLGY